MSKCLRSQTLTDVSCLGLSAWAKVEVTMDDSVEVYLGDLAEISCHFSFTDVDAEPSDVIIQWFVVSTAEPAAKADTARLVPSRKAAESRRGLEANGTNNSTAKALQLGSGSERTLLWTETCFLWLAEVNESSTSEGNVRLTFCTF